MNSERIKLGLFVYMRYSIRDGTKSVQKRTSYFEWLVNECHCDPNVRDNDGKTPLHYACM